MKLSTADLIGTMPLCAGASAPVPNESLAAVRVEVVIGGEIDAAIATRSASL